jgi:hypothetical protein
MQRQPVHTLDPADGTAGQGILIDPTGTKFIVDDLPSGGGGTGTALVPLTSDIAGELCFAITDDFRLILLEVPL